MAHQLNTVHRVPRTRSVDRVHFLESLARGRRVIHCGFWGTEGIRESSGIWLHSRLAKAATDLVGLDLNSEGVQQALTAGYEAHQVDCCDREAVAALQLPPAPVVIAGELIEHVETPGHLVNAMHLLVEPRGYLVITTPNAYALVNAVAAFAHREFVNPDHVALYSWYTLSNLLRRHGWVIRWFGTYRYPGASSVLGKVIFGFQSALSAVSPFLAHGLIAVCTRGETGSVGSPST